MEVWGIKYCLKFSDCEYFFVLFEGFVDCYLVDNDNFSMEMDIIIWVVVEAIGWEINFFC